MKATIEFNLDDQEDKDKFDLMNKASQMALFIYEWEQRMRSHYKYGQAPGESQQWDQVRSEYYALKADYDLDNLPS